MKIKAAVAVLVAMACWARAEADGERRPPLSVRLGLDLVDGSRIIGQTDLRTVPLITPYATVDLPLEQVTTMDMEGDHQTASVRLRNGDTLTGVPDFSSLKVETTFGSVTIATVHIKLVRQLPASSVPMPEELRAGLILRYSFDRDEDGTVTDTSGMNHTGKRQGGEWITDGAVGGALSMVISRDSVTVGDEDFPSGDSPRSFAWWFKTQQFPPSNGGIPIMEYGTRGAQNQYANFSIDRRVGRCNFAFSQWGGVFLSSARVSVGTWHHVVYSYSGGGRHAFFVDGQPSNGLCEIGALATRPGGAFRIGGVDGTQPSVITLDELCIYSRALSSEDARKLYDLGGEWRTVRDP